MFEQSFRNTRSKHNKYLSRFFKPDEFRQQVGVGENPMLNQIAKYMLDDISVPLPPHVEQRKIAREIELLNAKPQLPESIFQLKLAALNALKKLVLHRVLGDKL
jgi:type I restriction enzyme S subunit